MREAFDVRGVWLWTWFCAAAAMAAPPAAPPTGDERPPLAVSDLAAQGVTPADAAAMTDAVVQSLAQRGLFRVMSSQDAQAIVSAARQRELLGGCAEDRQDCALSLGAAFGARFVMTGALAKIGGTYQLSLQTLDTVRGQPVGRSTRLARDLATLRLLVPYVAAEATGSPLPPPPSRIVQYGLVATGSAALIGGAVLGMLALGAQTTLNNELCPGGPPSSLTASCGGTSLRPRSFYQAQDQSLGTQKSVSLALMMGGAAAAAAGLYFMPPSEGGPRVALMPTAGGAALVGVFP